MTKPSRPLRRFFFVAIKLNLRWKKLIVRVKEELKYSKGVIGFSIVEEPLLSLWE
jgi:hypothetical protein